MVRLPSLALGVLVALGIAACGREGDGITFQDQFPAQELRTVGVLPVALIDQTGLAAGLRVSVDEAGAPAVEAVDGDTRSVLVRWIAGECEKRVRLVLNRADGAGLELLIDTDVSLGAPMCTDVRIPRAVVVTFRDPIDPSSISVVDVG